MPQQALTLPMGEIDEHERLRRARVKAENFRLAAEAKKKLIEQEKCDRALRKQVLQSSLPLVPEAERPEKLQLYQAQEKRLVRTMCKMWTTQDFEPVCLLGKGAFGIVHLVRQRDDGRYVALKQMPKSRYREKNLRERAYCERQILAEAANRWFVELLATFHDQDHFYMVMEFLQGGDLVTHLERKKRLTEAETRFYMAELLEAIDVVHRAGFIHRDIKPDNVVLSSEGHLKLLDFGLCKADTLAAEAEAGTPMENESPGTRRQRMRSARGTPQYMAPEAMIGEVCPAGDIWALGTLIFECLSGSVAFHAGCKIGVEGTNIVAQKVLHHEIVFPQRLAKAKRNGLLSPEAEQLLQGLVCDVSVRLKAEQIRQEPFFAGVDFATLHLEKPPIVPELELEGATDTRFFPSDLGPSRLPEAGPTKDTSLEWSQYGFNRETRNLQQPKAAEALFASSRSASSPQPDGLGRDTL